MKVSSVPVSAGGTELGESVLGALGTLPVTPYHL